jgi:hypothetical protein
MKIRSIFLTKEEDKCKPENDQPKEEYESLNAY